MFEMLMFADDRQLADLRALCLEHVQRRWNSNPVTGGTMSGGASRRQAPTPRCKRRP